MKHSKISKKLNQYFYHIDRGGTLKGEVMAGITMFFISTIVLFMNVQLIARTLNENVVLSSSPASDVNIDAGMNFAQYYMGGMLIAFLGTIVLGLLANMPFSQISMMGIGTSVLSAISIETGLNYYNLLFVNFVAAVIYILLVSIPSITELVRKALPDPVRMALAPSVGLIFALSGLKASGIVAIQQTTIIFGNQSLIKFSDFNLISSVSEIEKYALIGAAITIIIYVGLKILKKSIQYFGP